MNINKMFSFRNTLFGFNKSDVISYIEKIHHDFSQKENLYNNKILLLQDELNKAKNPIIESKDQNEIINSLKEELNECYLKIDELKKDISSKTKTVDNDNHNDISIKIGEVLLSANEKKEEIINNAKSNADVIIKSAYDEAEIIKNKSTEIISKSIEKLTSGVNSISNELLNEYTLLLNDCNNNLDKTYSEIKDSNDKIKSMIIK